MRKYKSAHNISDDENSAKENDNAVYHLGGFR